MDLIGAINIKGDVKPEFSLRIDPSTIKRMKALQTKDAQRFKYLRILVEGGGCAGFSYAFDVISEEDKEKILESEQADESEVLLFKTKTEDGEMTVISDNLTMELINGSTISYT